MMVERLGGGRGIGQVRTCLIPFELPAQSQKLNSMRLHWRIKAPTPFCDFETARRAEIGITSSFVRSIGRGQREVGRRDLKRSVDKKEQAVGVVTGYDRLKVRDC